MYTWLDWTITWALFALNMIGALAFLATIDKPREYVTVREGLRTIFLQIVITFWLLWFGYEGRTIAGGLMTIATWTLTAWRLMEIFRTMSKIENAKYATRRSGREVVMSTISVLVQTAALSLMVGLALAYS